MILSGSVVRDRSNFDHAPLSLESCLRRGRGRCRLKGTPSQKVAPRSAWLRTARMETMEKRCFMRIVTGKQTLQCMVRLRVGLCGSPLLTIMPIFRFYSGTDLRRGLTVALAMSAGILRCFAPPKLQESLRFIVSNCDMGACMWNSRTHASVGIFGISQGPRNMKEQARALGPGLGTTSDTATMPRAPSGKGSCAYSPALPTQRLRRYRHTKYNKTFSFRSLKTFLCTTIMHTAYNCTYNVQLYAQLSRLTRYNLCICTHIMV
jgi:hypothetical protein